MNDQQYCELGHHYSVAITVVVEARALDCAVPFAIAYVCDKHVPTLADTLAHNDTQGSTLVAFETRRIATGEVIETYDACDAEVRS